MALAFLVFSFLSPSTALHSASLHSRESETSAVCCLLPAHVRLSVSFSVGPSVIPTKWHSRPSIMPCNVLMSVYFCYFNLYDTKARSHLYQLHGWGVRLAVQLFPSNIFAFLPQGWNEFFNVANLSSLLFPLQFSSVLIWFEFFSVLFPFLLFCLVFIYFHDILLI